MNTMRCFNVYLHGKLINTVWYVCHYNSEDVKRSLVNHDGYHPAIVVVMGEGSN